MLIRLPLFLMAFFWGYPSTTSDVAPKMPEYSPARWVDQGHKIARSHVLYIGDSLSVGPFGQAVEKSLIAGMGRDRVWFYASCGSSVQSWLAAESIFVTPCGYRESTPERDFLDDFHQGQRPVGTATPKIEQLLEKIRPEVVIVQLGTNHFDTLKLAGLGIMPKQAKIFESFAQAVRNFGPEVRAVIWITPPDCAQFPESITGAVKSVIDRTAKSHDFHVIDSRQYTHYVKGVTGSDGVHYARDAASKWANHVIGDLNTILQAHAH